jgi:hypothetical protein
MGQTVFRYTFDRDIPLEEVEASILLAAMGCEGLHGPIDAMLHAGYFLDKSKRACVLDASSPIGRDFNRMFTGFLNREFSADAYCVELVERESTTAAA